MLGFALFFRLLLVRLRLLLPYYLLLSTDVKRVLQFSDGPNEFD